MSTKKDGIKRSTIQTKKTLSSSTKHENSTDRRTKKMETSQSNNVKKKPKEVVEKITTNKMVKKGTPSSTTPTISSRTTRTQFFPNSQTMYKNALKEAKKDVTVVKKPGTKEIPKQKPVKAQEETSISDNSLSERPRTATLRRPSIVNRNIVGPDVPIKTIPMKQPDEDIYEDDFDSYESDFEAYSSSTLSSTRLSIDGSTTSSTSTTPDHLISSPQLEFKIKRQSSAGTDDERKLDSGTFDLSNNDFKHKHILDNIKESIEKENVNLNMASLSDEGFEDSKSLQYINFQTAQKKYHQRKSVELKKRRGEEILSMIRLDTFTFTLFDMPSVPYDDFIKLYGKTNNVQAVVQTGDDDIDEEIQTIAIATQEKWTQFPAVIHSLDFNLPNFWSIYKSNYLGVGYLNEQTTNCFNSKRLETFILSAGQLIMKLQTEKLCPKFEFDVENEKNKLPFSHGLICMKPEKNPMLEHCRIEFISFSDCTNNNAILTVHVKKKVEIANLQSIISFWDLNYSVQVPKIYLVAHGIVKRCCFLKNSIDIISAGLNDGTILIWNLNENIEYNNYFTGTLALLPSFSTEIHKGHQSEIVALKSFQNNVETILNFTLNPTKQILSLDADGDLITWDIYTKEKKDEFNSYLTQWGGTFLMKKSTISFKDFYSTDLHCTNFVQDYFNPNHIFVSTTQGFVIYCSLDGVKRNFKQFKPNIEGISATCLEMCPYSESYFLVGFSDGNVCLYSKLVDKPIMVLSEKKLTKHPTIDSIRWSHNVSFIFYTINNNNLINVWNLSDSDMFPIYSIPFDENITTIQVTQGRDEQEKKSYMMIGTEQGLLYLHLFNTEHGIQSNDVSEQQYKLFINYVNRL